MVKQNASGMDRDEGQRGGRRRPRPPEADLQGLQDEIGMLRMVMRQVMSLADDGRSLNDLLHILDSLSQASTRLASLLKAERALGEEQELGSALNQALAEVIRELQR